MNGTSRTEILMDDCTKDAKEREELQMNETSRAEILMDDCAKDAKEPQIDMVITTLMKSVRENEALLSALEGRLCAPSPKNEKETEAPRPVSISAAISAITQELNHSNNRLAGLYCAINQINQKYLPVSGWRQDVVKTVAETLGIRKL